MRLISLILINFFLIPICIGQSQHLYHLSDGKVVFTSDAPLELISATSSQAQGLIDPNTGNFAFSIPILTFKGFNSSLQNDHFHENFMETNLFPTATFSGKIVEKINFSQEGQLTIRAKGSLNIHGIKRERIIKSVIQIEGDKIQVKSFFSVLLKEHNITIPKIVNQKIAKEILVSVDVNFVKTADTVDQ